MTNDHGILSNLEDTSIWYRVWCVAWQRVVNGINTAWSAHVISAEINPVVLGDGLADISNDNGLTRERKEDVGLAFGIPASKLFGSAANYATAKQHEMDFYTSVIVPQSLKIQSVFNAQIFSDFGMRLKFLPETLSVFQQDEAERAKALQLLVSSGMQLSVASQVLGYTLPVSVDFSDLDSFSNSNHDGMTSAKASRSFADGYDTEREAYETALSDQISDIFNDLPNRIAGNYLSADVSIDNVYDNIRDVLNDILKEVISFGVFFTGTEFIEQEFARKQVDLTNDDLDQINENDDLDQINEDVLIWLRGAPDEIGTGYMDTVITSILATTKRKTGRIIAEWIEEGSSKETLERRLRSIVFSQSRARKVANTEVTRAFAQANRAVWRASNVVKAMRWQTAHDARVCSVCRPLHGKATGLYDEFALDIEIPPAHPECRCWLTPVV